jgi:hypothetical protein
MFVYETILNPVDFVNELGHMFPTIINIDKLLLIIVICLLGKQIYRTEYFRIQMLLISSALVRKLASLRLSIKTFVLSRLSSEISEDRRPFFRSLIAQTLTVPTKHSHPEAAASRNAVRGMIKQYELTTSIPMYYVSMSNGEQRSDELGDKLYYVSKDMLTPGKISSAPKGATIALIDVDYYMDMTTLHPTDYLIYTFDPLHSGGVTANASYTIVDDKFKMLVNGGATYEHGIWDYSTDTLFVHTWYGGLIFTVETHRLCDARTLIHVNYRRTVYTPLAWYAFSEHTVKRKSYSLPNGFNHHKTLDHKGQVMHHISKQGNYFDVRLSDQSLSNILIRTHYSKAPQLSDVERIFKSGDPNSRLDDAAIIYDYIMSGAGTTKTISTSGFSDAYQTLHPLVTEDGKDSTRRLGSPIIDGASFAPARSHNNDYACVKGRIENVKNKVTSYPNFYYRVMDEYLARLIPDPHRLVPDSFDQQASRMTRPTQRRLVERVLNSMNYARKFCVQAFQKAEAYGKITDPRNISNLPMNHNFRLGQFSKPMSESIFKNTKWYAFGHHPKVVSQRVGDVCRGATTVVPSDISKMDGSCGKIYYDLDLATVRRAFALEHHTEVTDLLNNEKKVTGYTATGIRYEAEYNTLSGSSKTSWGNTNRNAFTVYLALCLNGRTFDSAWDGLGLYGGDDGITPDIDPIALDRTFAKLGLLSTSATVGKYQPVPFLGRIYLNPWINDHSICDVVRQISKLHISVSPSNVPDNVALYRKALGYMTTDLNTPIITNWSATVLKIIGDVEMTDAQAELSRYDSVYWAQYDSPFEAITKSEKDLAYSLVANQLNMSAAEVVAFDERLSNATTIHECYPQLTRVDPKIEITAVHDGIVKEGGKPNHQDRIAHVLKHAKLAGRKSPASAKPRSDGKSAAPVVEPRHKPRTVANIPAKPKVSGRNL